jgi:hypothetical protein
MARKAAEQNREKREGIRGPRGTQNARHSYRLSARFNKFCVMRCTRASVPCGRE